MDVYYYFNYSTPDSPPIRGSWGIANIPAVSSGWMVVEALPLVLSPTVIIALLSPEVRESTTLEEYLSRSLGLTLIAFSILLLLLTGSVPLTVSAWAQPLLRIPANPLPL